MNKIIITPTIFTFFILGCTDSNDRIEPPPGIEPPIDSCNYNEALAGKSLKRFVHQATLGTSTSEDLEIKEQGLCSWLTEQLTIPPDFSFLESTMRHAHASEPNDPSLIPGGEFNNPSNGIGGASANVVKYQALAWWEGTLESKTLLRQRVAYALSQLIVVSTSDGNAKRRGEGYAYFYDLLYNGAFSSYEKLLYEIALTPIMGQFLSHDGNRKAYTTNNGANVAPDENFARELLQLFSVGLNKVDDYGQIIEDPNGNPAPTYTQQDVENVARVLTGWYTDNEDYDWKGDNFGRASSKYGYFTKPMINDQEYRDMAPKEVFGSIVDAANPHDEVKQLISIIMSQSTVGPHVVKHLISQLITHNPSPDYIYDIVQVFNDNGDGVKGDLKAVIKAILLHDEARNVETSTRVKEPIVALLEIQKKFKAMRVPNTYIQNKKIENYRFSAGDNKGVYPSYSIERWYGYAPLRSETVFNFYPAESAAKLEDGTQWQSPPLNLLTDANLGELSKSFRYAVNSYQWDVLAQDITLEEFGDKFGDGSGMKMLLNFEDEYEIINEYLDGNIKNIVKSGYREILMPALVANFNDKVYYGSQSEDSIAQLLSDQENSGYLLDPEYPSWKCRVDDKDDITNYEAEGCLNFIIKDLLYAYTYNNPDFFIQGDY